MDTLILSVFAGTGACKELKILSQATHRYENIYLNYLMFWKSLQSVFAVENIESWMRQLMTYKNTEKRVYKFFKGGPRNVL